MTAIKKLHSHLQTLGYSTETLPSHPLRCVGTGGDAKSLGLIQVNGRNIGYINIIKESYIDTHGNEHTIDYYLEYLVPLKLIPSCWCRAECRPISRGFFRYKVIDIEWKGDVLVEQKDYSLTEWEGDALVSLLNRDSSLKQQLMVELQLNRGLSIRTFPEPDFQCARIGISGIKKLILDDFRLPSQNLLDCLDIIAGIIARHETEAHDKLERLLLKANVEINPNSENAQTAECYVTDKQLLIKSDEKLQIPINQIENCESRITHQPEASYTGVVDYNKAKSMFRLKYKDALHEYQIAEFEASFFEANSIKDILSRPYAYGIAR